jgi:hypothetical protein
MINYKKIILLPDSHIRDFLFPWISKVVLSYYILLPLTTIQQYNKKLWNPQLLKELSHSMFRGLFVHVWMYLGLVDKNWWRWGGLLGVAWLIRVSTESVEWFIEEQALLPSYDLGPSPPSSLQFVSLLHSFWCRRSSLLTGKGEGVGEEPNRTTARKPGPL